MNHAAWLANREERRFQHEDIDYGDVEKAFNDYHLDALLDGLAFPRDYAVFQTLSLFEEQGLTESMLEDIIAED